MNFLYRFFIFTIFIYKNVFYDWHTLRKIDSSFLSNSMEYEGGDSFSSDFEPIGILFGSKKFLTEENEEPAKD